MMAWRVMSVLAGLCLAGVTASAAEDQDKEETQVNVALAKAEITMTRAIEIAMKEVKGAKPYEARIELDDGKVRYEVAVMAGEECLTVQIDAVTGKVLEIQKEETQRTAGHRWNFDKDSVGQLPLGWVIKQNNPTKELANWTVEPDPDAPSKPNVLNVKTGNGNATFNLALLEKTSYKDLNLSVRIRGNSGEDDQGGGLIWRCKDENNYYVCRINPIENNYRLYKVVDGKRSMLRSVDFETPAGKWFIIRVRMKGNEITCYCNGRKWLEARDDTFKDAGMIGLWTKADACSSFDDLRAWPIAGK